MAVMVNAIVRDLYSGDAMASLMSTVSMLFMVVPVIAPSLGQFILFFGEWQLIFVVLFAAGAAMLAWVMLRLPETLDAEDIRPISAATIVRTWGHILGHRGAMGHVLGSGIAMGGLFGFLTSSQQIFVETFAQGERFALWFAVIVSLMALTNFTNSRIVERFGARRVSQSAMFALVGFSGSLLIITLADALSLPIFVILLAPALATIGFTGANFQSIAMEDFGHEAGTASSLQSFIRMTLGVVIGSAIGLSYDGSVLPMLYGLLSCGLISIVIIGWAEHWRYFQRPRKSRLPLS
jgi:DHA1 family bicyclomycin/chloramphenicol resistance-like MFS transporter